MRRFVPVRSSRRLGVALLLPAFALVSFACAEPDVDANSDGVADDADGGPVGSTGMTGGNTFGDGAQEGGPATTGGMEEGGAEESTGSVTFLVTPDGVGNLNQCNIWTQDCPEGEKCMPYASDGGGSWNATRCSELSETPDQPGDECSVEGGGVSGIDSCDLSAMCWDVDGETNLGTCVGFCEGSAESPLCSDPDTGCSISNDGTLILCLPYCDPLLQDCGEGGACYPEAAGFFCSPDASGADQGVYGDACEFLNVCDPGLYCADASAVPGCAAGGCCSPFCDASDPAAVCPGAGQTCVAFWNDGEAPPGEEDYGLCLIEA